MIEHSTSFTASELVLLNGQHFASESGWLGESICLLDDETKVVAAELGRKMLAAAFLTIEAQQGLRLVEEQKKILFGLLKTTTLCAELGPNNLNFPTPSLETFILRQLSQDREEVSTILYDWLKQDSHQPWQAVVDLIKDNLVQRGLLDEVKEQKMKIFTVKNHVLPPETVELLAAHPIEPLRNLLTNTEQERSAIWQRLIKHIDTAISKRRESDSGNDGDFDGDGGD